MIRVRFSGSQDFFLERVSAGTVYQKFSTTCDESLNVERVQPKDILRSQGCLQHYHGHSVLMRRLVWIFFEIESPDGTNITFCNMVCWGTLYQLCIPILDKTAATVSKCITERWIQYLGPPLVIIADQGKGTHFREFTNASSILLHIIDVRAPWQNGRTATW